MDRFLVAAWVCGSALTGFSGVDAVWSNAETTAANWVDLANWTDSAGNALTVAPTNAADHAHLSAEKTGTQVVWLPAVTPLDLGTVSGNAHHTIRTSDVGSNGVKAYRVNLGDVSAFEGLWNPGRSKATFAFTGAARDVEMSALQISLRPQIDVPSGTTVTLGGTTSGGALQKSGLGKLTVVHSDAAHSEIFYHNGGTLELAGVAPGLHLSAEPLFWVDASRTNTMEFVFDEVSGRLQVEKWYDCRVADGVHTKAATPINNTMVAKPWISEQKPGGLTVVDFGSLDDTVAGGTIPADDAYGPPASLTYNLGQTVKEILVVWLDQPTDRHVDTFVIGQTELHQFHRGQDNASNLGTIADGNASSDLRDGKVFLDGIDEGYRARPMYGSYHVLNYALAGEGLQPNTFCNDRNTLRRGGARIAEALFFAEHLSDAERRHLTDYLSEKWMQRCDANVLDVTGEQTAVSVPEGREAAVREVVLAHGTLRKEGAGTLKVARFQTENPTVVVADGVVKFDQKLETVKDDQPAAEPVFWADATVATSIETEERDGRTYVKRWNDCRPDGTTYSAVPDDSSNKTGRFPFISEDTCNGRPVVDFGDWSKDEGAYMVITCGNVIREAFEVIRIPRNGYSGPNVFGCSGQELLREGTATLLHGTYAYKEPVAGLWTMDGNFVDPWAAFTIANDRYYVASFSSESMANAHFLGTDRAILNNGKVECGDTRLGEFIAYNRRLTDVERRQTIAYLMRKWKGEGTLFTKSAGKIGKMVFTADNPAPRIEADVDTVIDLMEFEGVAGFSKTGDGKVTVNSFSGAPGGTVRVAGEMEVKAFDCLSDATFHVDASVAQSISYRAGQESDARIDKWQDCRLSGRYAATPLVAPGANYGGLTNAVLRVSDGHDGLVAGKPYVDFLEAVQGNMSTNSVSGMFWYEANGAQWKPSNVREFHIVYKIAVGASGKNATPIGSEGGPNNWSLTPSGNAVGGYWPYSNCTAPNNALKKGDGSDWFTGKKFLSDGTSAEGRFHVLSIAFTNNISAYSFDIDRASCGRGGVQICEAVIFTGTTNNLARADAIHDYLRRKWMADAADEIVPALAFGEKLELAPGASLKLSADRPLVIDRLSGSGTFDVGEVRGVSRVDVSIDEAGLVSCLRVNGQVTFADTVEIVVEAAHPAALKNGTYTFLEATALKNVPAHLSDWTVVLPEGVKPAVRLHADGGRLSLDLVPQGTVVLFR